MIKFLHAADLHLDSTFAALDPRQAALRRQEQRRLVTELCRLCRENECDLLLLSGDLFDGRRVYLDTLDTLRDELSECGAQVFIAPGNHDPIGPTSPYLTQAWPENVHIFTNAGIEAIVLREPACVVYGAAFTSPSMPPLLRGFRVPEENKNSNYEYTFDTFIVGSSNNFAHAACMAVATNPSNAYNPLFLYGNSGLGKTHLLFAIQNEIKKNYPEKNICYIKIDDFINEMVESLKMKTMIEFRQKYRQVDVLLVDDVQFLGGKEAMQEEFFHTFNALYDAHKHRRRRSKPSPTVCAPALSRILSRTSSRRILRPEQRSSSARRSCSIWSCLTRCVSSSRPS